MNKVTTVNLNGRACQMEEQAYEALRAYLDEALRLLEDDPDCREIMADLEQAIADKGARYLGASRNVLSEAEMKKILDEMGPVEPGAEEASPATAAAGAAQGTQASATPPPRENAPPKRLYQIKEGAMISGVCNGLAAYFGVDPTIMRLIFVLLLLLSSGTWILVYLVLMFVLPTAKTAEERAAARGQLFNAQELIDETKRRYSELKEGHDRWRAKRRREREKEFWRARHSPGHEEPPRPFPEPQPGYGAQVAAGIMLPLLGIASAVLTVACIVALVSLLTTGEVLGWSLPRDIEPWTGVVALLAAYGILVVWLRAARYAAYDAMGRHRGWFVFWDGVLWLAFVILAWWVAVQFVPGVRESFQDLFHEWRDLPLEVVRVLV